MGFLTSVFGGSDNAIVTVILALGIVLVLILLAVWALKVVFNASGTVARGRQKRLHVTEVTPIDQKRQLILVRRDDVEHLILIGGSQELLIESGISVVEQASARQHVVEASQAKTSRLAGRFTKTPAPASDASPKATSAPITPEVSLRHAADAATASVKPSKLPAAARVIPGADLDKINVSANERKPSSLRHTGLLRPGGRVEPSVFPTSIEKSDTKADTKADDSDKHEPAVANTDEAPEQQNRGEGNDDSNGNNEPALGKKTNG